MRSRLHRARAAACAAALSLSFAACLAEDELVDQEGEDLIGDDSSEIVGQATALGPNLVQLTHWYGNLRTFSVGFVLGPNLVVGGTRSNVIGHTYRWRSAAGQEVSGSVPYENDSPDFFPGITMYETGTLPTAGAGINMEAPAAINGRALSCFGFRQVAPGSYQAQRVLVTINNPTTNEIPVVSVSNLFYLDNGDLGAPCVSTIDGKLYGVVKTVTPATRRAVLFRAASVGFQAWLEGIQNLILVRNDGLTEGPFTIEYQPQAGNRMCLDVPSASPFNHTHIQQYPCHEGDNQLWYVDHNSPTDPGNPRLVSASTGRCIDVPNGSSASGVRLQQYQCHDGASQKFRELAVGGGLIMLQPKPGLTNNPDLCLSVVGGPGLAAMPTEQRTCWFDSRSRDQRWMYGP